MTIWNKIQALAKDILGSSQTEAVDLSKISQKINRPEHTTEQLGDKIKEKATFEIEVIPEYDFVIKAIKEKCPAIFVTGKAGTGKSTLIKFITNNIANNVVLAPTATAAINVNGSTIHSFFGLAPRTINPEEVERPREQSCQIISKLDVLIIDEVSMVSSNMLDCIDYALKKAQNNNLPFGGISVVLIGDLLQLPPIIDDKDVAIYFTHKYDSPYFYSATVFNQTKIYPIELTRVFRQNDNEFIAALDAIRTNNDHRDSVALFNRTCYRDRAESDKNTLCLVTTNRKAAAINASKLEKLPFELETFYATYEGRFKKRRKLPAPDQLKIKQGAKIILLKNNHPYWINGSMGEVVSILPDTILVKLANTGNIVHVPRASWSELEYKYNYEERKITSKSIGTFTQFPMALGWAITIHKAQGMTIDSFKINLGDGSFCTGQTYVALSRCPNIDGITLATPIAMKDVKADSGVISFYKKMGFLKTLKHNSALIPPKSNKKVIKTPIITNPQKL